MKIAPIVNNRYYKYPMKNKQITFKGKPLEIQEVSLNANDFSKYLANASYWNAYDDSFQKSYISIRKNNLDKINTLNDFEKKKFISQYCNATGFPSLKNVSENIENEFMISANACSTELNHKSNSDYYSITQMGYDSTCSVGKRYALPGSDIDRGYIILKGCDDNKKNEEIVNEYSGKLWDYTDQRLLSFNHYKSFPIIKTEKQVQDDFAYYDKIFTPQNKEFYSSVMLSYSDNNYVDVNPYLMELKNYVPISQRLNLITNAYLAEVLREGKKLSSNSQSADFLSEIQKSSLYNYSNITQLKGIKLKQSTLDEKYKMKYKERQELCRNFDNYDIEQKIDVIKSFISASCEIPNNREKLFNNTQNLSGQVEPVLSEILFDNRDFSLTPKINEINGGYEIIGSETGNNRARLYLNNYGKDRTTIYAEFENIQMINYVHQNKQIIKSLDMFADVNKMQFTAPKDFHMKGFNFVKPSENSYYSIFECDF